MPSNKEVVEQSMSAYTQWAPTWRKHAERHAKYAKTPLEKFKGIGIGKACLAIANGYSFEKEIQTIYENQDHCDIFCVDKCLKSCIENGIQPDYCLVCDAGVDDIEYLDPVADKLQDTTLFINVCANPKWTEKGNWKEIVFFVNKDVLKSEEEFSALSNCQNFIPAGTNVSNALIILINQSDNEGRKNFFGYDKILLIGFDYCWDKGKYYAFNPTGYGKDNYMRNVYLYDRNANFCFSSTNLLFSARWLNQYITVYNVNAVQCSRNTILTTPHMSDDLGKSMRYNYKTGHADDMINMLKSKQRLLDEVRNIDRRTYEIQREHEINFIRNV